jgi:hypothetical protein
MQLSGAHDDGRVWSRDRDRVIDRRRRPYKVWARRRAKEAARLGRVPSDGDPRLDMLTDLLLEADLRRAGHKPGDPGELASEIRRLMTALDLRGNGAAEGRGLADLLGGGAP